jgi:AcrR family transcriptional regulator
VAKRAGVRRSTLYRHFADEAALFAACTGHWMASNPVPDPVPWGAIDEPAERLEVALRELYSYYRRNEQMMANILRDEDAMPIVKQMFGGFRHYLADAHEILLSGRHLRGSARQRVPAAIGLALAFSTWRSLVREQGLDDPQAANLMCRLVTASQSPDNR